MYLATRRAVPSILAMMLAISAESKECRVGSSSSTFHFLFGSPPRRLWQGFWSILRGQAQICPARVPFLGHDLGALFWEDLSMCLSLAVYHSDVSLLIFTDIGRHDRCLDRTKVWQKTCHCRLDRQWLRVSPSRPMVLFLAMLRTNNSGITLQTSATTAAQFTVGRVITFATTGLTIIVVPIYLAETSPRELRGMM